MPSVVTGMVRWRIGSGQAGTPDELEEPALEVAVPARVDEQAVEHPHPSCRGEVHVNRWARKVGELRPSLTALSMARSSARTGADPARSMTVRDALVQRKPSTSTRSMRSSRTVVWTRQPTPLPRRRLGCMNSTGPWVEAIEAVEGGGGTVRHDRVVAEVEQPGHQLLLPGRRGAGDPQDVMTQPFDAPGSDAPVHLIAA